MAGFLSDISFGLRLVRHQPLMAAAGTISLTIGLGLNIVLFTLANAILLRSLPVEGADRLVLLEKHPPDNLACRCPFGKVQNPTIVASEARR